MSISLCRDDDARTEFWRDLHDLHLKGQFCDLEIVCAGSVAIHCHRLVVASYSSLLRALLKEDKEEGVTVVHLPDHPGKDVRAVVDGAYALATKRRVTPAFRKAQKSLSDLFDFRPAELNFENEVVVKEDPGLQEEHFAELDQDFLSFFDENPLDFGSEDEKPLSRKRKRTVEAETSKPNHDAIKKPSIVSTNLVEERLEEFARLEKMRMRKRASWAKWANRKSIHKFDDPVDSPSMELYNVMKKADTTIKARLLSEQLKVSLHCNKKHREASYFQVLVGLAKTEDSPSKFQAKPLAWSLPDSNDITTQFDTALAAFRELYGFSDGDMYYNSILFNKQGLYTKNRSGQRRFELRGEFAKLHKDELSERLANEEIIRVTKRYPKKADLLIEEDVDCELVLTEQMEPEVMAGIAVLVWEHATTQVTGRVIQIKEEKVEEEARDCMKALFDVWCIGRKPEHIPASEYLRNWYNKLMEPMESYHVLKKFLADDDDFSQRERILKKEKQCAECGKIFPTVTKNDNIKLANHKKMHYYMNFKCDCKEIFTSYFGKKNHVLLCHTAGGKHSKCEHCYFVGSAQAMKRHLEMGHDYKRHLEKGHNYKHHLENGRAYKCKVCEKEFRSSVALAQHRITHKEYKCEHCEEPALKYAAFLTHQRKFHPQEVSANELAPVCEVCGKKLASKKSLQRHMIGVHMDSKDRPHQCPDCDRGFPTNAAVVAHRMIAHIKSRPFKCRYDGCAEAFNCNASRGTHEKQKHGERFHIFQKKNMAMA